MHKIKELPEDFTVKEVSNVELRKKGDYSYYVLKKKNYTTEKAISDISNKSGIRRDNFSYAGTKDKKAVTEQMISLWYGNPDLEKISLKDIELNFLGKGYLKIGIGDLYGNDFAITVRNLSDNDFIRFANKIIEEEIREDFALDESKKAIILEDIRRKISSCKIFIPNYFDEQRFSKNNYEIGKSLIKKNFENAAKLILNFSIPSDELEKSWGNWEELIPKTKNYLEIPLISYLSKNPRDFVG
ncbi:MAG: tRNA pseudouridine(13) synthase TruD, partial [Candidatus Woesearchaeota archaeon]|nr:tRNA pseudouridine(13) synthase TruD [Candidatus Woesearchaeota archaeon]